MTNEHILSKDDDYGVTAARELGELGADGWFATPGGIETDVFSLRDHRRVLKEVQRSLAEQLVDDHNEAERRRLAARVGAAV